MRKLRTAVHALTLAVVTCLLVGCLNGTGGVQRVTDAARSCEPIGAAGDARTCPAGCTVIDANLKNLAKLCERGPTIVVGCVPHEGGAHPTATGCYTTAEAVTVVTTPHIYPELMEQGWEPCSEGLSSRVLGPDCM